MSKQQSLSLPPFWIGGVACSIATICTHPQDLVKVRLQTLKVKPSPGAFHTTLNIIKTEGVPALYNGLGAALIRQMTYSTVRFGTYDFVKHKFKREDGYIPFHGIMISALVAGCVGGGFGNPADIINVRMQNDGQLPPHLRRNYKNALDGMIKIINHEGVTTLFRGLRTSMARSVIMTLSQLGSYDFIKRRLVLSSFFEDNLKTHFVTSLLAGLVATTACSPIDVIKTRIMDSSKKGGPPQTIIKAFITIAKEEGPRAFFKGWLPSYLRLGPHTVITFMLLEQFKAYFRVHQSSKESKTSSNNSISSQLTTNPKKATF